MYGYALTIHGKPYFPPKIREALQGKRGAILSEGAIKLTEEPSILPGCSFFPMGRIFKFIGNLFPPIMKK